MKLLKMLVDDYVVIAVVVSSDTTGEQAESDFKNWYKGLDYKNFPSSNWPIQVNF